MDPKIKDYTNALKEQDSKNILKILYTIWKDADSPKNKANINQIREKGTLKFLVDNLKSQHKSIIDVCLSILGNILIDPNYAKEALRMHILEAVIKVLKRYPNEDSISGKSLRILGNICQHTEDWVNIMIEGEEIIIHLVEVLKDYLKEDENVNKKTYSEATFFMALRALRYLWNQYTIKFLITNVPALAVVLLGIFIKTTLDWQKNKTYILEAKINLFRTFYEYKGYIINELKNTDWRNALKELPRVLLLLQDSKEIVKYIMILTGIGLKSNLPIPDICYTFVEHVFKKYIGAENEDMDEALNQLQNVDFTEYKNSLVSKM